MGVIIARDYLADRELDGLSGWINGRPFVLLNNTKSAARSRLDLAHEFGHLALHRDVDPAAMADKPTRNLIEKQAFQFARALLLPRDEFPYDIGSGALEELLALKSRWQVSIAALIYRIDDLGLLPKATTDAMWRKRARHGWQVKEPLEDAVRLETPTILKSSNEVLRDQGELAAEDIIARSGLPTVDYLRLCDLDSDFIQASMPANVIRLVDRSRLQS